jgi:basic membrane lipoprotein Med (substrate-binding protein (PBP1-ABC) superfamily)
MTETAGEGEEVAMEPLDIEPIRITIIMPSPITDLAWSQAMYDSLLTIQEMASGPEVVEIAFSESVFNVTDAAAALRDYADSGYDLIITRGTQYATSLFELTPNSPETSFTYGTPTNPDTEQGLENIFAYEARAEEGGYVNGVLAANLTESNVIGVEEAHTLPLSSEYFAERKVAGQSTSVWMQNAEPLSVCCADETDVQTLPVIRSDE